MSVVLTLLVAATLTLVGLVMLGRELRLSERRTSSNAEISAFFRGQLHRRVRIAAVLCVLGVFMGVGGWVEPRERPIVFISAWFGTALAALWLLWLSILDFLASRLHWTEQLHRNLVDIAKAKADLRELERAQIVDSRRHGPQGN